MSFLAAAIPIPLRGVHQPLIERLNKNNLVLCELYIFIQLSILAFGLGSTPQESAAVLETRVKELETELALYKNSKQCSNGKTEKTLSKVNPSITNE